jgi:hypothetical protein
VRGRTDRSRLECQLTRTENAQRDFCNFSRAVNTNGEASAALESDSAVGLAGEVLDARKRFRKVRGIRLSAAR